jgi:hypothetical protein
MAVDYVFPPLFCETNHTATWGTDFRHLLNLPRVMAQEGTLYNSL